MRLKLAATTAAIGLAALAVPAFAQPSELTGPGADMRVFSGGGDGQASVDFPLTIGADEAVYVEVIPANGSDWDPRIEALDAEGNVLAEDDDGGGGLGSRLLLLGSDARNVTIRIATFGGGEEEGGAGVEDFLMTVRTTDNRPPTPVGLAINAPQQGNLNDAGAALYRISGAKGEAVAIAVDAITEGLDPLIEIHEGGNARRLGDALGRDDDGGDGLNSLLYFVFPDDGDYLVRVTSIGGGSGSFAITASAAEGLSSGGDQPAIAFGDERDFTLVSTLGDAAPLVPLSASARSAIERSSRNVAITLLPTDDNDGGTDPVVAIGFQTPLGFSELRSDDDGAGGLGSRLVVNLAPFVAAGDDWLERLRIRPRVISGGIGQVTLSIDFTDDQEGGSGEPAAADAMAEAAVE